MPVPAVSRVNSFPHDKRAEDFFICASARPGRSRDREQDAVVARPRGDVDGLVAAGAENFSALSTRLMKICTKQSGVDDDGRVRARRCARQRKARAFDLRGNFRRTRSSSSATVMLFKSKRWVLRVRRASCSTFSIKRDRRSLSL